MAISGTPCAGVSLAPVQRLSHARGYGAASHHRFSPSASISTFVRDCPAIIGPNRVATIPDRSTVRVTFEPFPSGSITCVATPFTPPEFVSQENERLGVSSVTVQTFAFGDRRM